MKKIFAINYKLRYAETSDWGTEYVNANNKTQALNIFAKLKKISVRKFNRLDLDNWEWEEGVWRAEFRNIKQVQEVPCPHCGGTGVIHA